MAIIVKKICNPYNPYNAQMIPNPLPASLTSSKLRCNNPTVVFENFTKCAPPIVARMWFDARQSCPVYIM